MKAMMRAMKQSMTQASTPTQIAQWRHASNQVYFLRIGIMVGLLFTAVIFGITLGALTIDVTSALSELEQAVITDIRAPRVAMTILTGAGLAVCGLVLQAICRNPLADPGLIGVSSGAAFFASLAILLNSWWQLPDALNLFFIPGMAFFGAALALFLLLAIASYKGSISTLVLILTGVALDFGGRTLLNLVTYLADENTLRLITFWQMGSYSGITWSQVALAAVVVGVALPVFFRRAEHITLLQIGEQHAWFAGVNVGKLKHLLLIVVAAVTAVSVCFTGIIGFVGLVVPHICRMLVGTNIQILLPASAISGAALITFADVGARLFIVPAELPIGLITSAIGVPFFLWLVMREKRKLSHA